MNRWVESRLPIASIDRQAQVIRFGKRAVFTLEDGDHYYIENAERALDKPGEWYLTLQAASCGTFPWKERRSARPTWLSRFSNRSCF